LSVSCVHPKRLSSRFFHGATTQLTGLVYNSESKEFLLQGNLMLAKMTSKNQITLPKAIVSMVSPSDYFEVEAVNDKIMLTPVRMQKMGGSSQAVRHKLAEHGITEQDVLDAVNWVRKQKTKEIKGDN
jgi:hypothetical protein